MRLCRKLYKTYGTGPLRVREKNVNERCSEFSRDRAEIHDEPSAGERPTILNGVKERLENEVVQS